MVQNAFSLPSGAFSFVKLLRSGGLIFNISFNSSAKIQGAFKLMFKERLASEGFVLAGARAHCVCNIRFCCCAGKAELPKKTCVVF